MNVIHKYELTAPVNRIKLPLYSKVLSVQSKEGVSDRLYMWVEKDMSIREIEERTFVLIKTGDQFVPRKSIFLGTVQTEHGNHVNHVFEDLSAR